MMQLTLKKPASFFWLSMEAAISSAISDVYPALPRALEHNTVGKNNTEAKGLLTKVKSVDFLLIILKISCLL